MDSNKNIYEILNNIETDIEGYNKEVMTDFEKNKYKKIFKNRNRNKTKFKKVIYIAVSLVLLFSGFASTDTGKKVYAKAQSRLLDFNFSINKILKIDREIDKYVTNVDMIVEKDLMALKLTDVILDNNELILSNIIEVDEEIEYADLNPVIYLKGKEINHNGASGTFYKVEGMDNLYYNINKLRFDNLDFSEEVDLKIVYNDIKIYNKDKSKGKIIKDNFEYTLKTSAKELLLNTKISDINKKLDVKGSEYILENISINPVNQKIYGSINNPKKLNYDLKLVGNDSNGKEVIFYLGSSTREYFEMNYYNYDNDFNIDADYLILTPYAVKYPEKSGKMSDDWEKIGESFKIDLNN